MSDQKSTVQRQAVCGITKDTIPRILNKRPTIVDGDFV